MIKDNIIERFMNYVQIESPSKEEGEFAQVLKKDLEDLGFRVEFDDSKEKTGSNTGNLIAYLEGDKSLPTIMFSSHMDTVTPYKGIQPVIEGDLIKSSTPTILSADDKSGIVGIIEGVKYIIDEDLPHGDIEIVFTTCEEIGLRGSTHLDYSMLEAKYAFVLDSGGDVGEVITQGPAQTQVYVKFHGKSSHAGLNPEDGINAIQVAARAIDRMNLLRIDSETTANVGIIKGGSATNIVTDLVELKFECRSLSEEKLEKQLDHIRQELHKAAEDFNARVEIEIEARYPSFKIGKDEEIIRIMEASLKDIGLEAKLASTGGGSDTNIYSGHNIQAVNLATGMEKVHSTEEYIKIDNLVDSARMVASIIQNIK